MQKKVGSPCAIRVQQGKRGFRPEPGMILVLSQVIDCGPAQLL